MGTWVSQRNSEEGSSVTLAVRVGGVEKFRENWKLRMADCTWQARESWVLMFRHGFWADYYTAFCLCFSKPVKKTGTTVPVCSSFHLHTITTSLPLPHGFLKTTSLHPHFHHPNPEHHSSPLRWNITKTSEALPLPEVIPAPPQYIFILFLKCKSNSITPCLSDFPLKLNLNSCSWCVSMTWILSHSAFSLQFSSCTHSKH